MTFTIHFCHSFRSSWQERVWKSFLQSINEQTRDAPMQSIIIIMSEMIAHCWSIDWDYVNFSQSENYVWKKSKCKHLIACPQTIVVIVFVWIKLSDFSIDSRLNDHLLSDQIFLSLHNYAGLGIATYVPSVADKTQIIIIINEPIFVCFA